jgi:hypothetical protein
MAHQTVNPQGTLINYGMLPGTAFDGHRMQDPTWAPPIPGYSFDVVGGGRFYLLGKTNPATGVEGVPRLGIVGKNAMALDVDFTVGGVVPAVLGSICDSDSPTAVAELSLNAASRVLLTVTDELGTVQAGATSSMALTSGRHRARLVFSALQPINGARYVVLMIDGQIDAAATWSVDPLAPWAPFAPAWLFSGFRPGGSAFGGTIHRVQVGNEPVY